MTRVAGWPATSIDRTLADLGAVVAPWVVARSVEQAVIAGRSSIGALYRMADEHGRQGRSGIGALRAALDDWVLGEAKPGSVLEVMFGRVVERAALPMPRFQELIRHGNEVVARVDAYWPQRGLIAEVDGLHAHALAAALQQDLARQNTLVALGYTVLRFTWHDVVRRPESVVRQLAGFPSPASRLNRGHRSSVERCLHCC